MDENKIYARRLKMIEEGRKMKEYRKLMGIKQKDIAAMLDTWQSNYCKMENGLFNPGWRFKKVQEMFYEWRESEIKRLLAHIEYLKSL